MAHMPQELKKSLAPAIKAVLKKYNVKATLAVQDHVALVVNIKSGPIAFEFGDRDKVQLHEAHIGRYTGVGREFLMELRDAMNVGNHDKSNFLEDYHDVGWYIFINIGTWGRPYKLTDPVTVGPLQITNETPIFHALGQFSEWLDTQTSA